MTHPWRKQYPPGEAAAKRVAAAERKERAIDRQARYSPTRAPLNKASERR